MCKESTEDGSHQHRCVGTLPLLLTPCRDESTTFLRGGVTGHLPLRPGLGRATLRRSCILSQSANCLAAPADWKNLETGTNYQKEGSQSRLIHKEHGIATVAEVDIVASSVHVLHENLVSIRLPVHCHRPWQKSFDEETGLRPAAHLQGDYPLCQSWPIPSPEKLGLKAALAECFVAKQCSCGVAELRTEVCSWHLHQAFRVRL